MRHRKLRIAWSVAWGIVAVLLVALWAAFAKRFSVRILLIAMTLVALSLRLIVWL